MPGLWDDFDAKAPPGPHAVDRTLPSGSPSRDVDRADFSDFLREYGFTEAQMLAMSQRAEDLVPMPEEFDAVRLAPSSLHGMGMFAVRDLLAGEWLAPARLRLKRTPAGRYTNHARHPNCVMLPFDPSAPAAVGDLWLVAAENVKAGDELTVNYRQVGEVNGHRRSPKSSLVER